MRNAVVIVGSGMMGAGIAARSVAAGCRTILLDTDADRLALGAAKTLEHVAQLHAHQLITPEAKAQAPVLLEQGSGMRAALGEARLVIEAITEKLEAKQELFARLDDLLPENVPICSNSSGLQITRIAERVKHPARTMIAHFWFPAHLVPLVELVMCEATDEGLVQSVREELLGWGKSPVVVRQDLPGQLANRVLQAIIREAVNIVESGLATAEDVDTAIKMGIGVRLPVWGPLEHIDAVGLDLALSVQDSVLPEISTARQGAAMLRDFVAQRHLGVKTGTGFYDWSQKSIDELQTDRDDFIINALHSMQKR